MTTSVKVTEPEAGKSAKNPLKGLLDFGQSPWMDYVRRDLLIGGELQKLIDNDGLRGMTSNPSIFAKAISTSKDYSDILESPDSKKLNATQVYEKIAVRDIQDATDIFKPVYDQTKTPRRLRQPRSFARLSPTTRKDHRRSPPPLESGQSPQRDDQGSRHPGRHPRHPHSFSNEGININITLLFAQSAYEQVAEAYRRRRSKPAPPRART